MSDSVNEVPFLALIGNSTVNSAIEYVETSVDVSDNAFAVKAENDAFEPVISKDCTLIVEPNAELKEQSFAVIEHGGKQGIYFVKQNDAQEYIVTSNFVDNQYSKLMYESTIKGMVVQVKRLLDQ